MDKPRHLRTKTDLPITIEAPLLAVVRRLAEEE